jgi:two-component system chemotaxis response regulator CheB
MLSNEKQIKVLITEDSGVQRELLMFIFASYPHIKVVGLAKNGVEAIEYLAKEKPDVILMDLHMPKMNGIEVIQHIMSKTPLPIIAMSATSDLDEIVNGFHALDVGAVAFVEKPVSPKSNRFEYLCDYLIQTITLMSEVKVVSRRDNFGEKSVRGQEGADRTINLIAIGVSTGGPMVLKTILSLLPQDFPPILIVQHIVSGFLEGLIEWLTQATHCSIQIAENNQVPVRGHIYFAPDNHHMGIDELGRIILNKNHSENEQCPSVNYLFKSVAMFLKKRGMGILLTGMGNDGAKELKSIRSAGGITIAQSKETSLIFGMPEQAILIDAAAYILSPEEIANVISSLRRP